MLHTSLQKMHLIKCYFSRADVLKPKFIFYSVPFPILLTR